ncbi:acyloxyacyl hydrolase [Hymenobacter aerilatus]|uniref:Acyloxyacyl hydrolase n=1 Tax=Hymenobacter aerilatus TaxID=2932251 RepID=A0A8T9SWD2_9BACT|nr:acyloxyacyl hydrolase [Hymenobacter aerilatus]UOR04096.1 acyloxyacyl hydrolase [Hymenobacter aerilatus]
MRNGPEKLRQTVFLELYFRWICFPGCSATYPAYLVLLVTSGVKARYGSSFSPFYALFIMNAKVLSLPLLAALLCAGSAAHAQTEQGTRVLGLSGGNFTFQSDRNVANYAGSLTPSVGTFVADNIALGVAVPFELRHSKIKRGVSSKTNTYSLGVTPWLRYYIPSESRHRLFGEIGAGVAFERAATKIGGDKNGDTSFLFLGNIGAGYSYFITPQLGLEGVLSYGQNTAAKESQISRGTLGLNIGFRFYLSRT